MVNPSYIKVEIETLNGVGTYDAAIDVTDHVMLGGVSNISEAVDSGDYDIGLYVYADVNIKLSNFDGKFSSEKYGSSIFHYTRDRARVQITFNNGTDYITFKGLINEEATREDFKKGVVTIKVLSQDSILRKTKVSGGLISDGVTISEAIKNILNLPSITAVLGYDVGKISVGVDNIIDDVTPFTDRSTKDVLGDLLNASGSIFRIDSTNDMVVSSRAANAASALALYGNDLLGRDNIIDVKKYNEGLHRSFNSITVNDSTASDQNYTDEFGARIKSLSFDFITAASKHETIAAYLLAQFKEPKRELEVTVAVDTAVDVEILDKVIIDYSRQFIGWEGQRVPLYGTAIYDADVYPLAGSTGAAISSNTVWKVTSIRKDTKKFETILRLREI